MNQKRDISRNAGNICEKFGSKSWMILPRYEDVKPTTFVDVSNVSVVHDDSDDSPFKDMSMTEMLEMAIKKLNEREQ